MRETFTLKGLDCPNCGAKIEHDAQKITGVTDARLNLIKEKIELELSDAADFESVKKQLIQIVHRYEPDVKVMASAKHKGNRCHFTLKGLDCPNCAAKIERGVQKLDGVKSAHINLMKEKLTLHLLDNADLEGIQESVTKIVHKYEPDVKVIIGHLDKGVEFSACSCCPHCHSCHEREEEKETPWRLRRLIVGGLLAVISILAFYIFKPALIYILPALILSYLILGADVLVRAIRNIAKGDFFDENFLMALATIVAFVIGEYPEAVAVMLFYQIGEYFQDKAVDKSRKAIADLMDIRPDRATVLRNGNYIDVSPEMVEIGEQILVKPGEKIPLDGKIIEGHSMLDTRALTGESVPREIGLGDMVLSGCINQSSVLSIEVTRAFSESTASKIVDLVENASSRKAKAEHFITKFARYYTPIVVILAILLAVIPPLLALSEWSECIRRACIFLVISCPCALVISIPLSFFGGIGAASRNGVLVKGGNHLEALNLIDTIVFDKTGTLTKGSFEVVKRIPADHCSDKDLLMAAAKAECLSNHPIARSILNDAKSQSIEIDANSLSDYTEIAGHGTKVTDGEHTIYAGNDKLMRLQNIDYQASSEVGTKVYIGMDNQYLGCIVIADQAKPDSAAAIQNLKHMNIRKAVMLTGDDESIASDMAQKLGLDEFYAGLLPDQKVEKLESLMKLSDHGVAFVGDGINDAPVLARADVGIAMGGLGSDAAIEAADVVLMTDEPSKLVDAIQLAHKTRRIVMQNIILAIGIKVLFLLLGALGLIGLWPAVFADVGVMVLAVLNAMRMLRVSGQSQTVEQ